MTSEALAVDYDRVLDGAPLASYGKVGGGVVTVVSVEGGTVVSARVVGGEGLVVVGCGVVGLEVPYVLRGD